MPEQNTNPSSFWQELKRRKVIRVIIGYAAAAYVILELASIVADPLGLPEWTIPVILVLLSIGFIITAVISWIYDFTSEGIKKTESIDDLTENQHSEPVRRKFSISDGIIILLIIIVCILLYPRLFTRDHLKDLRAPDGKFTIAVMPFKNLTGDTTLNFWQRGISELLINDLGTSQELSVLSSQSISEVVSSMGEVYSASMMPSLAREAATKIHAATHITGSFQKTSTKTRILINMVETQTGQILWTGKIDGNLDSDIIDLSDSLSLLIKNYLEIKALERNAGLDYGNAFPNSSTAYRYYIEGLDYMMDQEYRLARETMQKAWEIDTTFTFAALYRAWAGVLDQYWREVRYWTQKAYEGKEKLPILYQNYLELWKACYITKNLNDIKKYADLLYDSDLNSRLLLFDLGTGYNDFLRDFDNAIQIYKQVDNLSREWGSDWEYPQFYAQFGRAYHNAGNHREELKIYERGLKHAPKDSLIHLNRCVCAVTRNDTAKAREYIADFLSCVIRPENWEAYQERLIGMIYGKAEHFEEAIFHYRKAFERSLNTVKPNRDTLFYQYLLALQLTKLEECAAEGLEMINSIYDYAEDDWPQVRTQAAQLIWAEARGYLHTKEYEKALERYYLVRDLWATRHYKMDAEIEQAEQALANQDTTWN